MGEPTLIAIIGAIGVILAPIALEAYRQRVKRRDAEIERIREEATREQTEETALQTVRMLKAEIRELKADRKEDRALVRALIGRMNQEG
jgi:FtsZ-binding cell division protein ZapB